MRGGIERRIRAQVNLSGGYSLRVKMELAFEIDVETSSNVVPRGDGVSASVDIDPRGRLLAIALGSGAGIVRAETFETAVPLAGISPQAKIERNIRFVDGGRHVAAFVRGRSGGSLRIW